MLSANVRKAQESLGDIKLDGVLAKPLNTDKLDQLLAELFSPSALRLQQSSSQEPNSGSTDHLVLDEAVLRGYLQSLGKSAMQRSAQLFAQLLPGYINKLLEAAVQQQTKELQSVAHKLKGAAAAVGLAWVMQQARVLEEQEPDWQGLQRQLLELHFTAEQHLATLQQYIEQY
jgi:two-component system aerobic respiration control sensor histidine kinase ArcB